MAVFLCVPSIAITCKSHIFTFSKTFKEKKWQSDRKPEPSNIGIWIVFTKSCTHIKAVVYFVFDIVLNIKQSKENVYLKIIVPFYKFIGILSAASTINKLCEIKPNRKCL